MRRAIVIALLALLVPLALGTLAGEGLRARPAFHPMQDAAR